MTEAGGLVRIFTLFVGSGDSTAGTEIKKMAILGRMLTKQPKLCDHCLTDCSSGPPENSNTSQKLQFSWSSPGFSFKHE